MTIYIVAQGNPRLKNTDDEGAEKFDTDRTVSRFFRNKGTADAAAKRLARKYPGELFAVFSVDSLFEAKEPEIMEKTVDDQGQIVPKG